MTSENRSCQYATAFAPGLIDPAIAAPEDLVAAPGKRVVKRYNVYRNNVTVSLIDALAAIYPAIQRITGVDFFRAMARFHIRETPPVSPLLFEYGRDFPAFIESYEYAREMPWLADTARVERAWLGMPITLRTCLCSLPRRLEISSPRRWPDCVSHRTPRRGSCAQAIRPSQSSR